MGYVLTNMAIDRLLVAMYGYGFRASHRDIVREWHKSLPVVSREAAERALWPMTDAEKERWDRDYRDSGGDHGDAADNATRQFFARRRDELLGKAPAEPREPYGLSGEGGEPPRGVVSPGPGATAAGSRFRAALADLNRNLADLNTKLGKIGESLE